MTVSDHIRHHLLDNLSVLPTIPVPQTLSDSEWNPEFELLMRNRLKMGAFRYGLLSAKGKPQWDRISSVHKRLTLYHQSHNTELLIDCANLLLLEFTESTHPDKHFHATDNTQEHVTL